MLAIIISQQIFIKHPRSVGDTNNNKKDSFCPQGVYNPVGEDGTQRKARENVASNGAWWTLSPRNVASRK